MSDQFKLTIRLSQGTWKMISNIIAALRDAEENQSRAEILAANPHRSRLLASAEESLRRFFVGKTKLDGTKFTALELNQQAYAEIILYTAMSPGIALFYEILERRDPDRNPKEDIQYLLDILHDCGRRKIPQYMIPGIACIHAELVGQSWRTRQTGPRLLKAVVEQDDEDDDLQSSEPGEVS
jgi:hypothetical protein